MTIANKILNN